MQSLHGSETRSGPSLLTNPVVIEATPFFLSEKGHSNSISSSSRSYVAKQQQPWAMYSRIYCSLKASVDCPRILGAIVSLTCSYISRLWEEVVMVFG